MTFSRTASRNVFVVGTVFLSVCLIALTLDFHNVAADRTREDENLTEAAIRGKDVWEDYNCVNCHTRLGEGAYYAPDVTVAYSRMGSNWIEHMLRDPVTAYWGPPENAVGRRKMPQLDMSDQEILDMVEFLKFLDGIDRNGWPPELSWPRGVPIPRDSAAAQGEEIFAMYECAKCHGMNGASSQQPIGPDLTFVASRLPRAWLREEIQKPAADFAETAMPDYGFTDEQTDQLVEYLEYVNERSGGIVGGHPDRSHESTSLATGQPAAGS